MTTAAEENTEFAQSYKYQEFNSAFEVGDWSSNPPVLSFTFLSTSDPPAEEDADET